MPHFNGVIVLVTLVASGCSLPNLQPQAEARITSDQPLRVVSLDYCADQFVLKLADRRHIVALSRDATRDFSYMRYQAQGLARVRPDGETILALKPDLVVRSYGGGPQTKAFLEKAGVKVHQIGWGDDFDAVRNNVRDAAKALGEFGKGEAVIAEFDRRLSQLKSAKAISALYVTSGGVTTGAGSMIDLMMTTAGLTNFQLKPSWNPLPLERLVTERPDMIAVASFGTVSGYQNYWSAARHPIVNAQLRDLPIAKLDGSTTTCAGWFIMDAIEVLAKAGREAQPSGANKQAGQL
jgi:iron complex transport system substrate-binding protein